MFLRSQLSYVLVTFFPFAANSQPAVIPAVHDARGFVCGFISDKVKDGRSGDASCSYNADKVFVPPLPFNQHCKTKSVFDFEDVRLQLDFGTNTVEWKKDDGLAPFAVQRMTDHYMRKENLPRDQAERRATERAPFMRDFTYKILHVQKSEDSSYLDPITKAPRTQPKNDALYTISFGYIFGHTVYTLFIPENGNSILTRYWSDDEWSWVNHRFGKCRAIK